MIHTTLRTTRLPTTNRLCTTRIIESPEETLENSSFSLLILKQAGIFLLLWILWWISARWWSRRRRESSWRDWSILSIETPSRRWRVLLTFFRVRFWKLGDRPSIPPKKKKGVVLIRYFTWGRVVPYYIWFTSTYHFFTPWLYLDCWTNWDPLWQPSRIRERLSRPSPGDRLSFSCSALIYYFIFLYSAYSDHSILESRRFRHLWSLCLDPVESREMKGDTFYTHHRHLELHNPSPDFERDCRKMRHKLHS